MQLTHTGTQPIETDRLILRRHDIADADGIFANWSSDPLASRFWSWQPHANPTETRAILAHWISQYSHADYYHWAIILKNSSAPIGYIYLDSICESDSSAAIHFLLGSAYWRRGLMTEACRSVIEYAFDSVGFRSLQSWHHSANPASGKVLQKCGMIHTHSAFRAAEDPSLSDTYLYYSITREKR